MPFNKFMKYYTNHKKILTRFAISKICLTELTSDWIQSRSRQYFTGGNPIEIYTYTYRQFSTAPERVCGKIGDYQKIFRSIPTSIYCFLTKDILTGAFHILFSYFQGTRSVQKEDFVDLVKPDLDTRIFMVLFLYRFIGRLEKVS